ncbi:hypothetical protein BURMUCF1_A0399 [Burkholderia multivorans ATCC BAA-247]|nr:hypothetical protein BURMUCF1_A0399 [Burkholderia multivorans ATCC BAA-247]
MFADKRTPRVDRRRERFGKTAEKRQADAGAAIIRGARRNRARPA